MYLKYLCFIAFIAALECSGCGYRPASEPGASLRLSVTAAPMKTPHFEALQAALSGVRAGLGAVGSLEAGKAFPRVVVEVLRVDELPTGIQGSGPELSTPLARGSAVGVVARAWIEEGPGKPPVSETGDIRRVEYVGQGSEPLASGYAYTSAVRSAARRVGEALARRILGAAEPGTDPM
jgi:hypothetical protein